MNGLKFHKNEIKIVKPKYSKELYFLFHSNCTIKDFLKKILLIYNYQLEQFQISRDEYISKSSICFIKGSYFAFSKLEDYTQAISFILYSAIYAYLHDCYLHIKKKYDFIPIYSKKSLKIKFQDSQTYFSIKKLIKVLQNLFLSNLSLYVKYLFTCELIFDTSFNKKFKNRFYSYWFKNEDINFNALIFFIQSDLLSLKINDFKKIKTCIKPINVYYNPLLYNLSEISFLIKNNLQQFNDLKIKASSNLEYINRIKRIYAIYFISSYILNCDEKSTEYLQQLYKELLYFGVAYKKDLQYDANSSYSCQLSENRKQLKKDQKIAKRLKTFRIEFNSNPAKTKKTYEPLNEYIF